VTIQHERYCVFMSACDYAADACRSWMVTMTTRRKVAVVTEPELRANIVMTMSTLTCNVVSRIH
jgi:hypothetical protein